MQNRPASQAAGPAANPIADNTAVTLANKAACIVCSTRPASTPTEILFLLRIEDPHQLVIIQASAMQNAPADQVASPVPNPIA